MDAVEAVRTRYLLLADRLDERGRRLLAAAEAKALGRGGVKIASVATGMSVSTVRRGLKELELPPLRDGRVRRPGAGRKRATERDPGLIAALEALVDPATRGDPTSALRWTSKSLRKLSAELTAQGHPVSHRVVGEILRELGYSLQANTKTREGGRHPDRDAQFQLIHDSTRRQIAAGAPTISVDTKKKELVGDFKNAGREWQPKGQPEAVRVHDFMDKALGKAIPYGIYEIGRNVGWVSVGVDHDTATFAVETIRRWWNTIGAEAYPVAESIVVVADGGGSNGSRVRLWKWELQRFADETRLPICVHHLPPGTSKWNKIEHRLFSFITQNWRGKPLLSRAAIVNMIKSTTTTTGLQVHAVLDEGSYPPKIRVTDEQMATINIDRDEFHGEWNYTIRPRKTRLQVQ